MGLSTRVPEDLLKELDEKFPDKCPDVSDSDRQIWINKGKREFVEFLKFIFEEQNANIMKE
jgi:hypothetical protein